MRTHELHSTIEVLGIEREICITFTYNPGQPERGPTYDSGGEPAHGPEIEVQSVSIRTPVAAGAVAKPYADAGQWLADLVQHAVNTGAMEWSDFADVVEG